MTIGELLEIVEAMNEVMPADTRLYYSLDFPARVVFVPNDVGGYTVFLELEKDEVTE